MLRDTDASNVASNADVIQAIAGAEMAARELRGQGRNARDQQGKTARDHERLASKQRLQLLASDHAGVLFHHGETTEALKHDELRDTWVQQNQASASNHQLDAWFRACFDDATDLLPVLAGSFAISLTFTLSHPYLSRDDDPMHILDNPVRKDKVFGHPMVAPSGWKGALRAALRDSHGWAEGHSRLDALCGPAPEVDEGKARAGRLSFFPTFFYKRSVEIINIHHRTTKVGKTPIPFECVPVGAGARFSLFYAPFDIVNGPADSELDQDQLATVLDDLGAVTAALATLFTVTGFGAKTSSGFGRAKPDSLKGAVRVARHAAPFEFTSASGLQNVMQPLTSGGGMP